MIASGHAQDRARERYGIDPTDADWREVLLAITSRPPQAVLLGWAPQWGRTSERWLVRLCGVEAIVIWDPEPAPNRCHVVTVLDSERRYSPSIAHRLERRLRPPRHADVQDRAQRRPRDRERAEMADAEGAA